MVVFTVNNIPILVQFGRTKSVAVEKVRIDDNTINNNPFEKKP